MTVTIRKLAIAAGVALAALSVAAHAGGEDIDATGDFQDEGPSYFGFVRDNRGSPVSDAQVTLRPKKGEPVVLKSNVLGLYRSHITKEVTPAEV